MATKIGLNGFGRIGRTILRQLLKSAEHQSELEIVAVNDLTDTATLAHLLQYDSVHGRANFEVKATDDAIIVDGRRIDVSAQKDPAVIPWNKFGVELVLECTGLFTKRERAAAHLRDGVKKVLISAPADGADLTMVYGVNHSAYKSDMAVVSCGSCTTNCLAPVLEVIHRELGVKRGTMTTIHSYTNDQNILDLPHKDLRRARAAALSMIPTSTGAARAIGLVLPALQGKLDGMAVRVPTADVSLLDLTVEVEKPTSVQAVNQMFEGASKERLKGVLGVSNAPLVSVDFIGDTRSSVVDSANTMVLGGTMVKVLAWYDNETGFSQRMLDVSAVLARSIMK